MSVPSVVLHGPESTGKSTLARRLAAHWGTVDVPEYGRTYCEAHGTDLTPEDLIAIMDGHVAARPAIEPQARGLLIQDTDPVMTAAWSMMLFGHRIAALDAFTDVGALYLLMDIDLPWIGDEVRMFPEAADQRRFFALCEAELVRRALPYVRISGDGEQRFARAVAAVDAAGLAAR
ncbi:AAA family ATPase [Sphingobium lignivorans]|uniref:NadR type nicotinamide-nucleotide adenylyltransferase n=1 Tax=Sphingobium lignivorans TaxID=2735886 RepID=A0ABR6NLF5_9SPHN|nr:ATP-binding protein [Sphingobium lignivorans]MBB5987338.1 NadR type nicotinamide-nucleotide adenylyltransferase [Sphingobium lignivorans]